MGLRRYIFKSEQVQAGRLYELYILVAIIFIALAILIPQCMARLKIDDKSKAEKAEAEAREKARRYYNNVFRLAQGLVTPQELTSEYGETYEVIIEDGQEAIPWPAPDQRFPTNPRYIRTGKGLMLKQTFPTIKVKTWERLPLTDKLKIWDEPERVVIRENDRKFGIEFPKTGRRLLIYGELKDPPTILDHVLSVVPLTFSNYTIELIAIYLNRDQVDYQVLCRCDAVNLPRISLIYQVFNTPWPIPQSGPPNKHNPPEERSGDPNK